MEQKYFQMNFTIGTTGLVLHHAFSRGQVVDLIEQMRQWLKETEEPTLTVLEGGQSENQRGS